MEALFAQNLKHEKAHSSSMRVLLHYAYAHKWTYCFGVLMLLGTNWIFVYVPLYFKDAIDSITNNPTGFFNPAFFRILGTIALLGLAGMICRTFSRTLFFNPAREVEFEIKDQLFLKLLKLSPFYFEKNTVGSIVSKLNNDITYVRLLFGFGALQAVNLLFIFSLAPVKMWQISPELTVLCMVPLVVGIVLMRFGLNYILRTMRQRSQDLQSLTNDLVSTVNGMETIHHYSVEYEFRKAFNLSNKNLLKSTISLAKWRMFTSSLLVNVEGMMKIIIIIFAVVYAESSGFTLGDMAAFISFLAMLAPPLSVIGWLTNVIRQGFAGLENLVAIFRQQERETLASSKIQLAELDQAFQKGIKVEHLSFRYPQETTYALENISFSLGLGKILGILGEVGSGKSTLALILAKYYAVDTPFQEAQVASSSNKTDNKNDQKAKQKANSGQDLKPVQTQPLLKGKIKVGEYDLSEIPEAVWRERVTLVAQDSFLFSDSVLENLHLGKEQKEEIEWRRALERSALDAEVESFPNKERQMIGEKGMMLSGGQRQRLSIARGILERSKLLIFDNVLSAVDMETENFLIQTIRKEKLASSMVIVSQRVKALEKADHIMVLEDGKIKEQGSHDELLALQGIYYKTYQIQKD